MTGVEALVRFARTASEGSAEILPLLARTIVEQTGCAGVVILEIHERGARFVPTPHSPEEVHALDPDPDLGSELGTVLLRASNGRFKHARVFPLVSRGSLFGQVALLCQEEEPRHVVLAHALCDLTALTLANEARVQQLARSQAELRQSQEALMRTEKLRALGQMAAGISHDLKNILNPLSLHLQVTARAIDRGEFADAKSSISEMKQIVVRGVQALERLRDYSRQKPESLVEEIDLDALAREACELARPRIASRGGRVNRIEQDLSAPPKVRGASGEILSALVNLIVNAIDAMPDGGTVTVRTFGSPEGSFVEVSDEGPGIPASVQRHIFEPFFTTKGAEGTGLGLAMVYACMQRHRGSVQLESEEGHGARFTLQFPPAA